MSKFIKKHLLFFTISILFIFSPIYLITRKGLPENNYQLVQGKNLVNENSALLLKQSGEESSYFLDVVYKGDRPPEKWHLLLATNGKRPLVLKSSIQNKNGSCIWHSERNVYLEDNSYFVWKKEKCTSEKFDEMILTITLDAPSPLHIWTVQQKKPWTPQDSLLITEENQQVYALHGSITFPTLNPEMTKLELLSHMWGQLDLKFISSLILIGSILFCVGLYGYLAISKSYLPLSFAMMWLGLTLCYTILVPPFQAPDEPDHLLSYARLNEDRELPKQLLSLEKKGHFERIKFHNDEKFTSTDAEQPSKLGWASHIYPPDSRSRSPIASSIWVVIDRFIHSLDVNKKILSLRLLQSLIVLAMTLAVLIILPAKNDFGRWLYLGLTFTMPSLIFYAFHVSNYFTAVSIYLPTGLLILEVLSSQKPRKSILICLGVLAGLIPYTNASGAGTISIWAACIFGIGQITPYSFVNRIRQFFYIFFPISLCFLLFNTSKTDFSLKVLSFKPLDARFLELLFLIIPFLILIPPITLNRKKSRLNTSNYRKFFAISIFLFVLIQNFISNSPIQLTNIEGNHQNSNPYYFFKYFIVYWLNFFPGQTDFYVSSSFWYAFGWLDTLPRNLIIELTRIPLQIAFIASFIIWVKKGSSSTLDRFNLIFIGLNFYFLGMAYQLTSRSINLHGRYLIFCYLLIASLCAEKISKSKGYIPLYELTKRESWRWIFLLSIPMVHGFCFKLLIERYF